jgi:membrane-bound serine protease (ClpP class)
MSFVAGFVAIMGFAVFATTALALKARNRPVVTGREDLYGADAVVLGDFEEEGWARVRGERWRVRSAQPMRDGERARVVAVSGLTLSIEKA